MANAAHVGPRGFDAALLDEIRSRFCYVDGDPWTGPRIYFENAGGSLRLKAAAEAAAEAAQLPDNAGRSHAASQRVDALIKAGLEDAAALFGARDGVVLAGQSTTGDVFRLLDTITAQALASGDGAGGNLVCTELDHPATYDATAWFARQRGLERRVVALDPASARVTPAAVAARIDERTIAVVCIHASNILGVKNDVPAIADAARARNPRTLFLADGAQHAQHGPVEAGAWGVDAYFIAAYKVFSKPGMSFTGGGPRLAALPHWKLDGHPQRQWQLGTADIGGFAAFSAAIDYLCWLGATCAPSTEGADRRARLCAAMAAIASHETALTHRMLDADGDPPGLLGLPAVRLLGDPTVGPGRESVFSIEIAGLDVDAVTRRFRDAGVIIHTRKNDAWSGHTLRALGTDACVRVSLAHYNTLEEVAVFLGILREMG